MSKKITIEHMGHPALIEVNPDLDAIIFETKFMRISVKFDSNSEDVIVTKTTPAGKEKTLFIVPVSMNEIRI